MRQHHRMQLLQMPDVIRRRNVFGTGAAFGVIPRGIHARPRAAGNVGVRIVANHQHALRCRLLHFAQRSLKQPPVGFREALQFGNDQQINILGNVRSTQARLLLHGKPIGDDADADARTMRGDQQFARAGQKVAQLRHFQLQFAV